MQVDSDKSSGFETSKGVQLVTWSWLQNFNFPFLDKPQYSQNWIFYQISSLRSLNWRSGMFLVFSQVVILVLFKSDGIFLRSIIHKPILSTRKVGVPRVPGYLVRGLFVSIYFYLYLFISMYIYLYLLKSICIYLNLFISIYTFLYLFISIYIYLYLCISILIYLYLF